MGTSTIIHYSSVSTRAATSKVHMKPTIYTGHFMISSTINRSTHAGNPLDFLEEMFTVPYYLMLFISGLETSFWAPIMGIDHVSKTSLLTTDTPCEKTALKEVGTLSSRPLARHDTGILKSTVALIIWG